MKNNDLVIATALAVAACLLFAVTPSLAAISIPSGSDIILSDISTGSVTSPTTLALLWKDVGPGLLLAALAVMSGVSSWLAATVPQATTPGTVWWTVRWVIDLVAANVGNAKNAAPAK